MLKKKNNKGKNCYLRFQEREMILVIQQYQILNSLIYIWKHKRITLELIRKKKLLGYYSILIEISFKEEEL